MIAFIKELLHGLLAPTLYAVVWFTFFAGIFKRAEWALYLLVILIPLPVVWYQLHPLPFGKDTMDILIAGTFLGIIFNKGGFERAPGTMMIGLFILVSFFSLWNATARFGLPLPVTTANPLLADWKNYVEMIFLYFLTYSAIRDEEQQKMLLVIMATVVLFICVREFRNFNESAGGFSYDKRLTGPFWPAGLGSNHFGAFVAHVGALLLGMYLVDQHKRRRWLYLATAAFSVHPLFFTYSRGAYLAAFAVILVYGLLKKRTLLVGAAVLVFTWNVVLPETVVERISMTESAGGEIEDSAAHRLILWQDALRLFEENFVFGIGFNSFGFTVPHGELTDTHNFYMKVASEQGLIGLIVLALILMRALINGWQLYRSAQSSFHQGLGLGFLGCTVAVSITNIFGDRFSQFVVGAYFWIFWALVDRARMLTNTAAEKAEQPELTGAPSPAP